MAAAVKHKSKEKILEVSSKPQNRFTFPEDSHLLITTRSQIYAWDASGLKTIFSSKNAGIVAAKETQDGTGILAVADKHVVVLHDTNRGQEKSWGLEADGDEIRHLEYTPDAKYLYFSTNLTSDIQSYSTEQARLRSPSRTHASPPAALAVSSTGHLMVSASDNPPLVYLRNLAHNTTSILIEPRASKAAVSVVSFHPDRANIFLLAFRDGTIAAYDATKIARSQGGPISNQEDVNKGEISHLTALHRPAPVENKRAAITDAVFLPGFKTRAVSAGSDGRCRVVDFADGGVVLRTWHAKAPVSSISVLPLKTGSEGGHRSRRGVASHAIGGPTGTDCLIAVGRADGQVHLYDSVGLLLSQQGVGPDAESIISVAWGKGSSPQPISNGNNAFATHALPHVFLEDGKKHETATETKHDSNTKTRKKAKYENIGLPPDLRKSKSQTPNEQESKPSRKFTIHPDEIEESTVRYTPFPQNAKPDAVTMGDYLDLFSPVKSPQTKKPESPEKRVASPPRSRPALTSQTFVKSPQPAAATQHDTMARRRNLALFPSTDSGSETAHPVEAGGIPNEKFGTAKKFSQSSKKRTTFQDGSRRQPVKSVSFKAASEPPNSNAQVLAELRKLSSTHPAHHSTGTLSSYGPSRVEKNKTSPASRKKETKFHFLRRQVDHIETEHDSDTALKTYEHVHKKQHWPEDSNQEASLDGDIWMTSASDAETATSRRSRREQNPRPQARQTSRSRVTSKGTMSTLDQPQPADAASASAQRLHKFDGSTEEDMFTADTHVTSSGSFSPSSKDVRDLFPRSSSLSPQKRRGSEKRRKRSPRAVDRNLRQIAPNEAAGRMAKSPWARARAGKVASGHVEKSAPRTATTKAINVFKERAYATDGQKEPSEEPHCSICGPTKARVIELEAEVAKLKGEVLVFKAVLRRQGVPLPPSLVLK